MRARALLLLLAVAALAAGPEAQVMRSGSVPALDGQEGQGALPNRLVGRIGIDERLGQTVPEGLAFRDETGATVRLGDVVGEGRPVLLAFVYHSCPMLCSLVLDGLTQSMAEADPALGEDYAVLAVSMDPLDTPARADSAKARYAARLPADADPAAFHFWTAPGDLAPNVEALADAVGFRYALDARTGEYAHSAGLVLLSPDGVITRYLYGLSPSPGDLTLGLVEAGQGTVGSALDRFLITCYEYDEDAQSYSLAVLTITKIGGALLLLVFGGLLAYFWRRESRPSAPAGWDDAAGLRPST